MRVYGVMEIPHAENNSRNSVRRLTCSNLKCYTTLIRRETLVPQKRGEPSEAKSGKPINVVHMSSTFAPSLITAIIFRRLGYHNCYRKRGIHLPIDEKKSGRGSGLFSEKNARRKYKNAFRPQSN